MTRHPITGPQVDEEIRRRFEAAWLAGEPRPVEDFFPEAGQACFLPTVEELLHIELEFAWEAWSKQLSAGAADEKCVRPAAVEDYLKRFPQLKSPDILRRLVEQEYLVRNQFGDRPSPSEFQHRFPQIESLAGHLETIAVAAGERDKPEATVVLTSTAGQVEISVSPQSPTSFGNYELLEEIGRGGMGVVYRARQALADRMVALKIVRRDQLRLLNDKRKADLLERFRHEALAAARLEHDHIVSVYDVGDVDGEPFFSMRYVDGVSLAELLREGPLENARAAAYLEPVALAVSEAHEKGILHRDIKPPNILIDRNTDHALVADFGLAKLVEMDSELTRAGDVLGTPAYMAPEQACDSSAAGRQSDVYSLGASLYHMLTGRPPFQSVNPLETIRQVIDELPVPPSRLNRAVDRDLETICLKCLEKEPSRRYETALDLANDLSRYRRGFPIVARPLGRLGIAVRWCRRNPALAVSAALAVTFLIAAFVATSIGYLSTRAALDEKSVALMEKSEALNQSERSYQQAREVVNQFSTIVSEELLLDQPGMKPLRRELLELALPHYERFLVERGEDPALRKELAKTHYRVALIRGETDSADAALPSLRQALTIQESLHQHDPDNADELYDLAATWNAIGEAETKRGQVDEAIVAFTQAKQMRRKLVDIENRREFQRVLANAEMNLGLALKAKKKFDEARVHLDQAQNLRQELIGEQNGDLGDEVEMRVLRDAALGDYNRANLEKDARNYEAVAAPLASAIRRFEQLKEAQPQDLEGQRRLALCYLLSASIKMSFKEHDEAVEHMENASKIADRLVELNPNVNEFRTLSAAVCMNTGYLRYARGELDQAVESFGGAKAILAGMVEAEPTPRSRRNLAMTLCGLAEIRADQEQWQAAADCLQGARDALGVNSDAGGSIFKREFAEIERVQRRIERRRL